jgi:uncharacterized protein YdaU (DUF1376 family)
VAEFPAFPVWTDAYAADTDHLSFVENGCYLKILFIMWRAPSQRIPNDDVWIARRLRCSAEEMVTLVRPLIAEFCQSDGNWITQKRLQKEWEYVQGISSKRRAAAQARWNKRETGKSKDGSPAVKKVFSKNTVHDKPLENNDKDICKSNAPTPTPTPTYTSQLRCDDAKASTDVRTDLFDRGLKTLARITGKTPDSSRSLVGKWLKSVNDEAIHVLAAIDDAARNRVADPVAWISRILQPRSHQNGTTRENSFSTALGKLKREEERLRAVGDAESGADTSGLLPYWSGK